MQVSLSLSLSLSPAFAYHNNVACMVSLGWGYCGVVRLSQAQRIPHDDPEEGCGLHPPIENCGCMVRSVRITKRVVWGLNIYLVIQ